VNFSEIRYAPVIRALTRGARWAQALGVDPIDDRLAAITAAQNVLEEAP